MKKVLSIFMILISIQTFSQFKVYPNCQVAEKAANDLAEKGIYQVQSYGDLPDDFLSDLWQYTQVYLYSKYGILIQENGSFITEVNICFGKETDRLIEKKFGPDFIQNIRHKISIDFDSMTITDKQSILDKNKIYGLWADSQPKFIGNDLSLRKLIKDKLIATKNLKSNSDFILVIDENGKISDFNYYDSQMNDIHIQKDSIIDFLNSQAEFIPAYLYDKKIKSEYSIYFPSN